MNKNEALNKLEQYYALDKELKSVLSQLAFIPDNEYEKLKNASAEILGQMFFYLMSPIYHEHKDLIPDELKSSFGIE